VRARVIGLLLINCQRNSVLRPSKYMLYTSNLRGCAPPGPRGALQRDACNRAAAAAPVRLPQLVRVQPFRRGAEHFPPPSELRLPLRFHEKSAVTRGSPPRNVAVPGRERRFAYLKQKRILPRYKYFSIESRIMSREEGKREGGKGKCKKTTHVRNRCANNHISRKNRRQKVTLFSSKSSKKSIHHRRAESPPADPRHHANTRRPPSSTP